VRNLPGQPARNSANQQCDQQTFSRHMHNGFSPVHAIWFDCGG
jgi:hypothetical protein